MGASTIAVISLSLVCLLLLHPQAAQGTPVCPGTREPQQDLSKCKYGIVKDWCRNNVCAKGPRETCGGRWLENGRCGLGMYCRCGHCAGCSSSLDCVLGRFC
ncbi:neuroparsin-A-like [Penaeus japonicus]|uniref:neuroparsin-A-like n=1 Tax=Penaeus japonicus TaxID=27405 RepID=UPI001C713FD7|nr:neuroparsin-A-like [Penaeus japonicus]